MSVVLAVHYANSTSSRVLIARTARRPDDSARAKYRLVHTVRTHMGRHKDAFSCMVMLTHACVQPGYVKLTRCYSPLGDVEQLGSSVYYCTSTTAEVAVWHPDDASDSY